MINKYLKTLLAEHKRVIITDFGGFNVKRSATGDVISFNSFLKFNDDLLANAIVEGEGVDKERAIKLIQKAVADINQSLTDEGKYEIEGVGFLMKDKKDNIRFVDEVNESVVVEETKEESSASVPVVEVLEMENSKAEEDEVVANEIINNENSSEDMKEEKTPPVKEEKKEEKKRWIVLWIVLVVLVLLLVVWLLFSNKRSKKIVIQDTTKTETVVKPSVTENYFMQPNQVDTVSGILVVADRHISPKGKERYSVILGSFLEKENAIQYNKQLRREGNASQVFDRYNGFTAVSLGGYPSLDIALRVCGEQLATTPGVWVLVK